MSDREQIRRDANDHFHTKWERVLSDYCLALLAELEQAERDLEGYRRALVAHHDIGNVSDAVMADYDFKECPVCRRAREHPPPPSERLGVSEPGAKRR